MRSIAFLGRGGQGIVFAASILAEALFKKGYYVVQLQSYGAEVRGGSVLAYVIVDKKKVENPFIEAFNVAIVLHEAGARRWNKLLENTNLTIVDRDLVMTKTGKQVVEAPIVSELISNNLSGRENMASIGVLQGLELIDVDEETILSVLRGKKDLEANIRAYKLGVSVGERLKDILNTTR